MTLGIERLGRGDASTAIAINMHMQPFAPAEAHEFIGKVALGLDPHLDL